MREAALPLKGEYMLRTSALYVLAFVAALAAMILLMAFWGVNWVGVAVSLLLGILAAGSLVMLGNLAAQKNRLEIETARGDAEHLAAEKAPPKSVEESLAASDTPLRALFESAAVGIGIMGLDRRIIDANPAMCRILGRPLEELVGQTPEIATFPEDYPGSTQDFVDLVDGKLNHYWAERRYVRQDGQVFWASVTMNMVRGTDGEPRYIVGMVIDIDDKKRAQEDLRESEARFRAMFDNAAVGIALMTLDRRIVSINQVAERIIGYSIQDLVDMDPAQLAHPDDAAIGGDEFREMAAGRRQGFFMEKRYIRKDGGIIWARVTYSMVPGKDGRPQYLIGMIEDITEQREARQRLEQQQREYQEQLEERIEERTQELTDSNLRLVGEIEQRQLAEEALAARAVEEAITNERTRLARDLHDAVTQTLFSASLIAEVLPDLWDMDEAEARRSADELLQLTRGALAEMRTLLLELRPAALTQARFPDLVKQLSEALIGRSRLPVNLVVEGEYELPPDVKVAFYRIAQESLNNIVKYSRATRVDIHIKLDCCNVYLEVKDNGIGFDPASIKTTTLGMRIMRERAEGIHAHLSIASTPGQGTRVTVDWNEDELIPVSSLVARIGPT
jgi:PAS domain S-box-containing protein